jgi:4-diphosphocytidyl-2C-methyl-D-erythritol kinase
VTVRVPAKVNLQLSVGPRESDGFHNLVSVFQAISIFDDVTVTKVNRVMESLLQSQANTFMGFQKTIQISL